MASEGPNNPGTAISTGGSPSIPWVNPGNALLSDDSRAVSTITFDDLTEKLYASNFGFAIPVGATILGIEFTVELSAGAANVIIDGNMAVAQDLANIGATQKRNQATFWPTTDAIISFGGATELHGLTWTYDKINSTLFGIIVAGFNEQAGSTAAKIDHITATVYFEPRRPTVLNPNQILP